MAVVELVTQSHSAFLLGTVGVGALAFALPELAGETAAVPELQDLTCARHHDPKLRLEVDVVLPYPASR